MHNFMNVTINIALVTCKLVYNSFLTLVTPVHDSVNPIIHETLTIKVEILY